GAVEHEGQVVVLRRVLLGDEVRVRVAVEGELPDLALCGGEGTFDDRGDGGDRPRGRGRLRARPGGDCDREGQQQGRRQNRASHGRLRRGGNGARPTQPGVRSNPAPGAKFCRG